MFTFAPAEAGAAAGLLIVCVGVGAPVLGGVGGWLAAAMVAA
jgi:hypothetical protein